MASYLVTGAAGFIGSRVVELLLAEGHEVVGVDNLNDAYDVRLKRWRLDRLVSRRGFRSHQLDICDRVALDTLGETNPSFDAVFNLAAQAGVRPCVEDPRIYVRTNIEGTVNLLDFCRRRGIEKFVLASTSSLYGKHNSLPYSETADTDQPLSPYSASKKGAEVLSYTYHHLYGLDVTVARYFTVYGPAGRPDMSIFRFIQWINESRPVRVYGDGRQSRDFTYIDDIARGTIAARKPLGYEVINLGSDHPVSIANTIQLIERLLGKKASIDYHPAHPADISATWADITKAGKLLGWAPETTHEEGVQRCIDWYLANQAWACDLNTGV